MLRARAGRQVGLQVAAGEAWRVPVNGPAGGRCQLEHHVILTGEHAGEVHHLGQPQHTRPAEHLLDLVGAKFRAGGLQRGRRNAARRHEKDVNRPARRLPRRSRSPRQRPALRGAQHILHACQAGDVSDLVGIGDDGGGPVRGDCCGELGGAEEAALDVNVSLDESGKHDCSVEVNLPGAVVLAHARYRVAAQRDVGVDHLAREHVEDLSAAQHQVRRLIAARDGDESLQPLDVQGSNTSSVHQAPDPVESARHLQACYDHQ